MPFFNLRNKNKLTLASHNIQVFKSLSLFIFIMPNKTGNAFFRIPIRRNEQFAWQQNTCKHLARPVYVIACPKTNRVYLLPFISLPATMPTCGHCTCSRSENVTLILHSFENFVPSCTLFYTLIRQRQHFLQVSCKHMYSRGAIRARRSSVQHMRSCTNFTLEYVYYQRQK